MISAAEIDNLAKLVRLELTPAEKAGLGKDLSAILGYVDELKRVKDPAPALKPSQVNVLRADEAKPWPDREALLAAFPERQGDYLKVKAILDYDNR
jgi:aspartyl-tRNA(Asn)/glutamyl-tRNA(Gln) amidotransferase subunit C